MPHRSATRVYILYEMAMAIGNSLDLDELLEESLKVILRKLDGSAICVYDYQQDGILMKIPRRGVNAEQTLNIQAIKPALLNEPDYKYQRKTLENGRYQYLFKLKDQGVMSLVSAIELDELMIQSMAPICEKLATAIQSCKTSQQMHHQEAVLKNTLFDLQKAQMARDLFLANMAHEIRTPLNGIIGFLGQLEDTPLTGQQQDYIQIIRHSSDSLLGVINDILDFSKIDSGKLELECSAFHLIQTIEPIVELFKAKLDDKPVSIHFVQQGQIPGYIMGDSLRLKQILGNLVSNAVKFTQQGEIRIQLHVSPAQDNRVMCRLSVADSGIGIDSEQLNTLGEPFRQASASTFRHFGGTGLGLAIVKKLIELMGSQLEIRSQLGKGSEFAFSWLAEVAEKPVQEAITKSNQMQTRPDLKVLLAEDNQVNQLLMKAVLAKMEIAADIVETGLQAVEKVKQTEYDLVLMDINMPEMDGVEATQLIREYERNTNRKSTMIAALTANVLKGDQDLYLSKGLDRVLAKPLDLNELNKVFADLAHLD